MCRYYGTVVQMLPWGGKKSILHVMSSLLAPIKHTVRSIDILFPCVYDSNIHILVYKIIVHRIPQNASVNNSEIKYLTIALSIQGL